MIITEKTWVKYIEDLKKVDDTAAERMARYLSTHAVTTREEINRMLEYAYGLSTKYGEAAAELACEMFDAVAAASGTVIPAAEPAATATMAEVAKTINGVRKRSQNVQEIASAVGRMVKMSAADTTLKNAIRTGAEFAWIPHGDTCAFCIMLASNGWKRASKAALKGGHAEHIHSNCDCQYAVRFNNKTSYGGYDPDKYKDQFDNADGDTWQEKLNALRRKNYAANKEAINEQKRIAYATKRRMKQLALAGAYEDSDYKSVFADYLNSAKPGSGRVVIEGGRKLKNREEENQRLIHKEFGGDIIAREEINAYKIKSADYLWRGKEWEEQEPTKATLNSIDQNVREALKQIRHNPGGIVLDIGGSDMPLEDVHKAALARLRRSARFDCDLVLIKDGKIADVTRYKKS